MSEEADKVTGNKTTLELFFITLLGLAFGCALIAAFTYGSISAQAPLVILGPLLLLVGAQINRTRKATKTKTVVADFSCAVRGKNPKFSKAASMTGWIVMLMLLIYIAGHYVGIAAFMFILLNVVSKEGRLLSAMVSAGVTVVIYFLFEHGFNIEMYRGLIYDFLFGYLTT